MNPSRCASECATSSGFFATRTVENGCGCFGAAASIAEGLTALTDRLRILSVSRWLFVSLYVVWVVWIGTEDIYNHITGRVFWPITHA